MNFKRTTLSWVLVFLMVFSFSAGSFSTANADQVERYQVTGNIFYTISGILTPNQIDSSFEIKNGIIVKHNNTITFTYSHESPENPSEISNLGDLTDFKLVYTKATDSTWQLVSINGEYFYNTYCSSLDDLTNLTSINTSVYEQNNHQCFSFNMWSRYLEITPLSNVDGIAPGTYKGTGSASIQTIFGNFNLGTLAKTKIKATVTSPNLQLAFQAKNIPYNVTARLISIDHNGVSTYEYQDDGQLWIITVTPDGKLDGTLTYLEDRGVMVFSIQLQTN